MKYIVSTSYSYGFYEFARDFNKSLSLESRRISSSFTEAVKYGPYYSDFAIFDMDEMYHCLDNEGYYNDMPFAVRAMSIDKCKISEYPGEERPMLV